MRTPVGPNPAVLVGPSWVDTASSVTYTRFEAVTPIEVLHDGNLAVVRYRSIIDLTTPHGGGHLECWHVDTYVRDATATWRCRWSQATDTISD